MKKGKLAYIAVVAIVFAVLMLSYLSERGGRESMGYTKMLMGTVVEITIMEGDKASFDRAAGAAFAEMERLEGLFSSYKGDSDISRISRGAGGGPVKVSPEVVYVVKKAIELSTLSNGAFDPTVGVLAKAWGYSGESGRVPTEKDVKGSLKFVDYKKITVNESEGTVALEDKGMALNLGGVAKGYIVSRAVDKLKENGVKRAIVHAGGDMALFGTEGAEPFKVGVQHPREKGRLLAEAYVTEGAVATSGDYERFFEKDGHRYHHILDPSTGFPARRSISATVIAKDPTTADALSTAVFVLGPEEGLKLLRKTGSEGLIVAPDGTVRRSAGFKGKVYEDKLGK